MKYEVLLDNKLGTIWDITKLVSKATLTLKRVGSCGTLKLDMVEGDAFQSKDFIIENGNSITLKIDDKNVFFGYIFKVENKKNDKKISITCYDQIKYLLYDYSYGFINKKASEIITQIANEFKLTLGNIEDTQFVIPKLVQDNKKLIDIIVEALGLTSDNTGVQYCLYDEFGKLTLSSLSNMMTNLVISDSTHITDYTYAKDIENSYSRFKIVQDNESTGRRDVWIAQNSELMNKWGILQYFEIAQEGLNEEQIKQKLDVIAQLKGKEKETITLKSVGEFVRAGQSVAVIMNEDNIKKYFIINEVKHTFENGNVHNMDLTLFV